MARMALFMPARGAFSAIFTPPTDVFDDAVVDQSLTAKAVLQTKKAARRGRLAEMSGLWDYRRMSTPFWVAIIKTLVVGFMGWVETRKESLTTLRGEDAPEEPRWGGVLRKDIPKLTHRHGPLGE